ncbi:MAG: type II toxin-antitoxin system MqsA family antitoxin [Rickettsiales bacterium]|jgi:putative transcriptional regulator|nr:type II toxin-antitoxin system MqsA family antitoxin [Rickettsiales bacterium]
MVKKQLFDFLREGLDEAKRFLNGEDTGAIVHKPVDVKKIRKKYNLSQKEFASEFGLNHETVKGWEQFKRFPDNSSRILLSIIDQHPDIVKNVAKNL